MPLTPFWLIIFSLSLSTNSSSQAWSVIFLIASENIPYAALIINKHIIILAAGSSAGNPSLAPSMPAKLPTDESASERWCHASAINAPEFIFLAALLVYQYIISFIIMETTAAQSASFPGSTIGFAFILIIFLRPDIPISAPVIPSATARRRAATHSNLSCP